MLLQSLCDLSKLPGMWIILGFAKVCFSPQKTKKLLLYINQSRKIYVMVVSFQTIPKLNKYWCFGWDMRIDRANKSEQRIVEALGNKPLTSSPVAVNMCGTNLCSALVQPGSINTLQSSGHIICLLSKKKKSLPGTQSMSLIVILISPCNCWEPAK